MSHANPRSNRISYRIQNSKPLFRRYFLRIPVPRPSTLVEDPPWCSSTA